MSKFKYRSRRIIKEIGDREDRPDIICLQEVDHIKSFYGQQLTNLGYKFIFDYRDNKDATLLAWKSDKYTLIKGKDIQYGKLKDRFGADFERNNVGMVVQLKENSSNKDIVIANSHYHWHPMDDFVKYAQAHMMLECIEDFMTEN